MHKSSMVKTLFGKEMFLKLVQLSNASWSMLVRLVPNVTLVRLVQFQNMNLGDVGEPVANHDMVSAVQ